MAVSDLIRERIVLSGLDFFANDNIAPFIKSDDELAMLEDEVAYKVQSLMHSLVIDTENDHNTIDTARRVAKMFIREVYRGRYEPMPSIADFPNVTDLDQIYTVGPVTVRSACSHHLVPIIGQAWIGVIPGKRVIGISKFARLTEWIMARPQIQEEATVQLANLIEDLIDPRALAVIVRAQHMCMTWRGIRESQSSMTTSVMRGLFLDDATARTELLQIIKGQGF